MVSFTKEITYNLDQINKSISLPIDQDLDKRYEDIKKNLQTLIPKEAIEEQLRYVIYCPNCYSTNIKNLTAEQQISEHYFQYLCLTCRSRFNDNSKTPFEFKIPNIETWLLCWFLSECTDSIEYIATKLHLDIETIKEMLQTLQIVFNSKHPLVHVHYKDWFKKYIQIYNMKLKEARNKKKKQEQEIYQGIAVEQPIDTAEYRRQKNKQHLINNPQ